MEIKKQQEELAKNVLCLAHLSDGNTSILGKMPQLCLEMLTDLISPVPPILFDFEDVYGSPQWNLMIQPTRYQWNSIFPLSRYSFPSQSFLLSLMCQGNDNMEKYFMMNCFIKTYYFKHDSPYLIFDIKHTKCYGCQTLKYRGKYHVHTKCDEYYYLADDDEYGITISHNTQTKKAFEKCVFCESYYCHDCFLKFKSLKYMKSDHEINVCESCVSIEKEIQSKKKQKK
jgi:hypothetical protein